MHWFSWKNALIFSNFTYCPIVWHFPSITSTNKMELIQKWALQLLYNDYTSTCDGLFTKANKPSMELKHYWTLVSQICTTLDVSNPTYMHDLFCLGSSSARWPNSIAIVRTNTNPYGRKSLRSLGPQIWNSIPEHIESTNFICTFSKFD